MNAFASAEYLTLAPAVGLSPWGMVGAIVLVIAGVLLITLVDANKHTTETRQHVTGMILGIALICGGIACAFVSTGQMMDRQDAWDGKVITWLEEEHGIRSDVNTFTGSFNEDGTRTLTTPGIKDGHIVTVTLHEGPRNTIFLTNVK